jgi:HSP20 family protein
VIVTAELAGVDTAQLDLEIQGRNLILSGRRNPAAVEADLYQQIEIERGYFRRVIELGAEVRPQEAKARYEDGMLRIELPLVQELSSPRVVPIESRER